MSVAAIMENYRPELRAQILGGEDSYTDPKKLQFLLHWINGIYFLHFLGVQNRRPGLKKAKNSMHQLVQDFLPSTVVHEQGATFFVCIFSWFLDTPVKKKTEWPYEGIWVVPILWSVSTQKNSFKPSAGAQQWHVCFSEGMHLQPVMR